QPGAAQPAARLSAAALSRQSARGCFSARGSSPSCKAPPRPKPDFELRSAYELNSPPPNFTLSVSLRPAPIPLLALHPPPRRAGERSGLGSVELASSPAPAATTGARALRRGSRRRGRLRG